ncbi:neurofilament heavy polypeptide-like [Macrobrachium nipponense]|uniref:neurofilament heavy polypeptide-like n=1 Tax=Macrobrachium nipponense TaxID=159736 RepID=UPI0030C8C27C
MVGPAIRSSKTNKAEENESPTNKRLRRSVNKEEDLPAAQTPKKAVGRPPKNKEDLAVVPAAQTPKRAPGRPPKNKEDLPAAQTPKKAAGKLAEVCESPYKATRARASREHISPPVSENLSSPKSGTVRSKHLLVTPIPLVQPQTPTTRSKRGRPVDIQTPPRRSRRLSTDSIEVVPLGQTSNVETPTKRPRRLSTALDETDSPQVQTPTRRSRRLSTEGSHVPETLPLKEEILTRRIRRLSTEIIDSPIPQGARTPTRRSRRLSTDFLDDDITDEKTVQTPTRRSRRLSSGDQDVLADSSSTKPQQNSSLKSLSSVDLPDNKYSASSRRSRRLSGSGLNEKPLEVVEEVEKEDDKETEIFCTSKTLKPKDDILEVIVEDEKENETVQESDPKDDILEVIVEDEKENETKQESAPNDDKLEVIVEGEKANETKQESAPNDDKLEVIVEDEKEAPNTSKPKVADEGNELIITLPGTVPEKKLEIITEEKLDDDDIICVEEPCPRLQLEEDEEVRVLDKCDDGTKTSSSAERSPISSSQEKMEVSSSVKVTTAVVSPPENVTVTSSKSAESDLVDVLSEAVTNKLNGEPNATLIQDSEKNDVSSTTSTADKKNNEEKKLNSIPKESNNNSLPAKAPDMRGMPASGRWWKEEKKRFNTIYKDQGVRSSWSEKMKRKQQMKDFLSVKNSIQEAKKMKKAELRERQRLNALRREENARKSEIVQVIKDSRKIKKMKRKQLRYIETRDTSMIKK